MTRLFQIVIVGSNLVPLATGILAALTGAALFVSDGPIATDFDAQIRVYGIWFTGIFFLSLWMALNVKTCGPVLKIVFSLVALAGLARWYVMITTGVYPTTTLIGAIIEVATLGFIPWHHYILRHISESTSSGT